MQPEEALQKIYFHLFEQGVISQGSYLKALGHDYDDIEKEIKSMPKCNEEKLIVWGLDEQVE